MDISAILKKISEHAIRSGDVAFTELEVKSNWLGQTPATLEAIIACEQRIGMQLPDDYKTFLLVTNGFSKPNDIEPTFLSIEDVNLLKILDNDLIEIWGGVQGLEKDTEMLSRSIMIAGVGEEQHFLLIPPKNESEAWSYWKFAAWIPGQYEFESLNEYFKDVLHFVEKQ